MAIRCAMRIWPSKIGENNAFGGQSPLPTSYPAWIRTMNEGTKIPSVTVTLPGNIGGVAKDDAPFTSSNLIPSYFFFSPATSGVSQKEFQSEKERGFGSIFESDTVQSLG